MQRGVEATSWNRPARIGTRREVGKWDTAIDRDRQDVLGFRSSPIRSTLSPIISIRRRRIVPSKSRDHLDTGTPGYNPSNKDARRSTLDTRSLSLT